LENKIGVKKEKKACMHVTTLKDSKDQGVCSCLTMDNNVPTYWQSSPWVLFSVDCGVFHILMITI
jgi:hypothetical protein